MYEWYPMADHWRLLSLFVIYAKSKPGNFVYDIEAEVENS